MTSSLELFLGRTSPAFLSADSHALDLSRNRTLFSCYLLLLNIPGPLDDGKNGADWEGGTVEAVICHRARPRRRGMCRDGGERMGQERMRIGAPRARWCCGGSGGRHAERTPAGCGRFSHQAADTVGSCPHTVVDIRRRGVCGSDWLP